MMGETSGESGISSMVARTQMLGQLTPVMPSCFHSSLYFLSPWFSVNFLLTSIRNLALVLTSLRATG